MTVWIEGKYFGWILNIHNKWNFKPTDHASWGIYCASCKVSFCSFIFYIHPLYLCVNTLWNEFALQGPHSAGTRCAQTESGRQHKGGGGGHKKRRVEKWELGAGRGTGEAQWQWQSGRRGSAGRIFKLWLCSRTLTSAVAAREYLQARPAALGAAAAAGTQ